MIDQHNSLAEKFLKKGFWLYLFSFIIAPIGYIIKIIISGELTVSEVGILYGIISLITMISSYNDIGMGESLKHFIPHFIERKQYDYVKSLLLLALLIQIITSCLISAFFFFGSEYIALNYFETIKAKETLQVFAFFFIGLNIFQTINNFFMAIQDTYYVKVSDFIRIVFILISVLYIFIGNHSSLLNYSYSWLIGLYIGIIFIIYIYIMKYHRIYLSTEKLIFNKPIFNKVIKYAGVIVISSSAGTILGQMDMQMIIYFLGTKFAGYYTNYLSIITIPFIVIGPLFAFLFPVFSEMHGKGEYGKIKKVKYILSKNFILISIMFNLFFFIFAQVIAYTLFGEKYIESGNILQYSILFLIFNFLLQINFNILAGIGRVTQRLKIIITAISFNFLMNIFLINYIGVYGAALATGLGWFIIFIHSEYYLKNLFQIKFDYKSIYKNIFLMGSLGYYIYSFILPYSINLTRLESLIFLSFTFFIWLLVFILININTFKIFINEIIKIKSKNSF